MARPPKLDKVAADSIYSTLRAGAYLKVAARHAGVSASTLRLWMQKGKEKPGSAYGRFRRLVIQAQTTAEISACASAYRGALTDPDYALRFLSVRWKRRWNPKVNLEVSGSKGSPLRVAVAPDFSRLSDEELDALERIAARIAGRSETEG